MKKTKLQLNTELHLADQHHPTYDTTRDGFGIGLRELGESDPRVVGLCADLSESTRMHWFAERFPSRFIQMGVAEENMIGVAAGLALGGKVPVTASYASFSPGNSWGPLRSAVCYSNLPVIVVGGHSGLGTGADGATHQALEDIAMMRVLPNMTVVVPCDKEEARKAIKALAGVTAPAYLRTSKTPSQTITTPKTPFEVGRALELTHGSDAAIIACGPVVGSALTAAQELAQDGISARVINLHTIKPLDTALLDTLLKEVRAVITVEDHQVAGGMGSAVSEYFAQFAKHPPLKMLGVHDRFGQSGTPLELYTEYGLTAKNITSTVKRMLKT